MTVALIADVDADRSTPPTTHDGQPIEVADRPVPVPIRLRRPPASEPPYDAPVEMGGSVASATPADGSRDLVVPGASAGTGPSVAARAGTARAGAPPAGAARAGAAPGVAARAGVARAAAAPAVAARGNARTSGRRATASDAEAHDGPVSQARSLPSPAAAAARYVRTCLEVLNGFRPAAHLRTLPGSVEFATVVNQLSRRRNGRGHFPQAVTVSTRHTPNIAAVAANTGPFTVAPRGLSPANAPAHRGASAAQRNAPSAAHSFRLQRMRLDEPRDGVAEIAAVLSCAGSSLAMALRLERRDGQWICVLVQVI